MSLKFSTEKQIGYIKIVAKLKMWHKWLTTFVENYIIIIYK